MRETGKYHTKEEDRWVHVMSKMLGKPPEARRQV
jgi:hypothetical protein